METHAWAELPEKPNQPRYISVVSDSKGYYCVYHYLHPPDIKMTRYKSLEIAMIQFAFGISGHYPLPEYNEIIKEDGIQ